MTITQEGIDSTVTLLRDMRDGLLTTEAEEKKQHDEKVAGLVKIAHTWADKNGMNESVEELMEELGLPGRLPNRTIKIGRTGCVLIHHVLPYQHSAMDSLRRLVDVYGSCTVITQSRYIGTEIGRRRAAEDECICSMARVLDEIPEFATALDENVMTTVEVDLSCDSPHCHHGDGEPFAQAVEVVTEQEPERMETEKVYTRAEYPAVFSLLPNGIDDATAIFQSNGVDYVFVWSGEGGWAVGPRRFEFNIPDKFGSDMRGYWVAGSMVEEALQKDRSLSNQSCTVPEHPDREHLHITGSAGNLMFAELRFTGMLNGWVRVPGTFLSNVKHLCTDYSHPTEEHLHFVDAAGAVTYTSNLTYVSERRTRTPGTFYVPGCGDRLCTATGCMP